MINRLNDPEFNIQMAGCSTGIKICFGFRTQFDLEMNKKLKLIFILRCQKEDVDWQLRSCDVTLSDFFTGFRSLYYFLVNLERIRIFLSFINLFPMQ